MSRIDELRSEVKKLYNAKTAGRADWADWLWKNHVLVVANYASELARQYGASEELSRAAALLHDVADTKMKRENDDHEKQSLKMATDLMYIAGYDKDEIGLVVGDAIMHHNCHGNSRPRTIEGKILATADSLAHLKTDFYIFAVWNFGKRGESLDGTKKWVLKKIDRDFYNKILFDEIREDVRADYERIKTLLSR